MGPEAIVDDFPEETEAQQVCCLYFIDRFIGACCRTTEIQQ